VLSKAKSSATRVRSQPVALVVVGLRARVRRPSVCVWFSLYGNFARYMATIPATNGVAMLVPLSLVYVLFPLVVGHAPMTFSPGALSVMHVPWLLKEEKESVAEELPTAMTAVPPPALAAGLNPWLSPLHDALAAFPHRHHTVDPCVHQGERHRVERTRVGAAEGHGHHGGAGREEA